MDPYMYKRNNEGIHIINLAKTWEKLMVAARIIAAIPNPGDVLVSYLFLVCFANLGQALGSKYCETSSWCLCLSVKIGDKEPFETLI